MRWALPDRVFFACGACHILAWAFLERHGAPDMKAIWIKPVPGFTGNHIFVSDGAWVFDYHGYSQQDRFLNHTWRQARRQWPGWEASLVELPREALTSEAKSKTFEGLWLREPGQFLHNALPRAEAYLDRFQPPGRCSAGKEAAAKRFDSAYSASSPLSLAGGAAIATSDRPTKICT